MNERKVFLGLGIFALVGSSALVLHQQNGKFELSLVEKQSLRDAPEDWTPPDTTSLSKESQDLKTQIQAHPGRSNLSKSWTFDQASSEFKQIADVAKQTQRTQIESVHGQWVIAAYVGDNDPTKSAEGANALDFGRRTSAEYLKLTSQSPIEFSEYSEENRYIPNPAYIKYQGTNGNNYSKFIADPDWHPNKFRFGGEKKWRSYEEINPEIGLGESTGVTELNGDITNQYYHTRCKLADKNTLICKTDFTFEKTARGNNMPYAKYTHVGYTKYNRDTH